MKTLKNNIENDARRRNDLPCLWTDINSVKIIIQPRSIYRFKTFPTKMPK